MYRTQAIPKPHRCTHCRQSFLEHPNECQDPVCIERGIVHFPPLCCPGCGCQSHEEAHAAPVDHLNRFS